jgi:hypothetical protein
MQSGRRTYAHVVTAPDILRSLPLADEILESHRHCALVPSIEARDAWLQDTGRENWSDELALIVAEHHRLSRYGPTRPHAPLVEAFRRADLVDVSQGMIGFGIPNSYVKEVRAAFDASVFFKRVIPSGAVRALRKLQPPGFLRPSNALVRSGHEGVDR